MKERDTKMKKRLKGLLALSMVVVMVLAMTTGVASAAVKEWYYSGSYDSVLAQDNTSVVYGGDIIKPEKSGGGRSFAEADVNGNYITTTGSKKATVSQAQPTNNSYVWSNVDTTDSFTVEENEAGYYGYYAVLGTFNNLFEEDGTTPLYSLYLDPIPINFVIQYDPNQGTGNIVEQSFYVTDAYTVYDGSAFKRDGYRLSGWNTSADGKGIAIPLGSNALQIAELLKLTGRTPATDNDNTLVSTLYAQWTPLDSSPAAGDTFPTAPLLMLMFMSAGAAVVVKRRKA